MLLAPIVTDRKGEHVQLMQDLQAQGFIRARINGEVCELDDPQVIDTLAQHTLILYIQVTNKEEENKLIERAQSAPKPLYYRADFLQNELGKDLVSKVLDPHNIVSLGYSQDE